MSSIDFLERIRYFRSKLDEYVKSAKKMDEQTFKRTYENDQGTLPFCVKVLQDTSICFYRSRLERKIGCMEDLSSPQTFSYVPLAMTNEHFPNLHRANFSGQSVFYGSIFPQTNFREISDDITVGENIYMAKWSISPDANLILNNILPPQATFFDENFKELFGADKNIKEEVKRFFQDLSEIFMSTEKGNSKYLVSALYSYFVYNFNSSVQYDNHIITTFDGILYPSTKINDRNELNVALKPEFIDKHASLQYVIRGKVAEDLCSIDYTDIGYCKDGVIQWYSPWVDIKDITPIKIYVWDTNDSLVDIKEGVFYDKDGKKVSDIRVIFEYQKDRWADEIFRRFPQSFKRTCDLKELEKAPLSSIVFPEHIIVREVEGWKFIKNNIKSDISKIGFEFQVRTTFKRTTKPKGLNI